MRHGGSRRPGSSITNNGYPGVSPNPFPGAGHRSLGERAAHDRDDGHSGRVARQDVHKSGGGKARTRAVWLRPVTTSFQQYIQVEPQRPRIALRDPEQLGGAGEQLALDDVPDRDSGGQGVCSVGTLWRFSERQICGRMLIT
jgi:hypothetical protein